jgi:hypothetical protein
MVNFKTKSGVTISIPGSLGDPKVEQKIRDIKMSELKDFLKSKTNNKPSVVKKRGGVRGRK